MINTTFTETSELLDNVSNSSYSNEECFICLERVNINDFQNIISPCKCKTYVHRKCFSDKQNYNYNMVCETCCSTYDHNIVFIDVVTETEPKSNIKSNTKSNLIPIEDIEPEIERYEPLNTNTVICTKNNITVCLLISWFVFTTLAIIALLVIYL
jgi:hypothetical protein